MKKSAKKPKRKSTAGIGNDHEKEYEQMLIADGWLTHKTQMARGWERNKDIFKFFDIIAFRGQRIRLSQIKTTNLCGCLEQIREWAIRNRANIPNNVEIEVALKKYATKRKVARWRVYTISKNPEASITHYDIGGEEKRSGWGCIVQGDHPECKKCDGMNVKCKNYLPPQLPAIEQECE
jgi:hypothetical protein